MSILECRFPIMLKFAEISTLLKKSNGYVKQIIDL